MNKTEMYSHEFGPHCSTIETIEIFSRSSISEEFISLLAQDYLETQKTHMVILEKQLVEPNQQIEILLAMREGNSSYNFSTLFKKNYSKM